MKKWHKLLVTILIILIIYPYLKTEYLTYNYAEEFNDKKIYEGHFIALEYMKVFEYSDKKAKVYYVSKNKEYGMVFILKRNENGPWKVVGDIKSWSKTGSADDFIWPYYP